MRIIFWGTPEFAVPSLRALLGEGHEVVAVITQPDRPAGRGRALRPPAVKMVASEEALLVLQPERPRGEEFLSQLRALQPDLSVVVAYGQILRPEVLEVPRLGSINVHASLLPKLRGAAPIAHAILQGHEETGVTIMRMVAALDAGPILHQVREPIGEHETATELAFRLSEIGAEALIEALALLEVGEVEPVPQDDAQSTYAPLITRETAALDWSRPAEELARLIRAMDEVPGAWTIWRGQELKLYRPLVASAAELEAAREALVADERAAGTSPGGDVPGTVLAAQPADAAHALLVACGTGALWVREVKPQGKRRMTTAEWLRGRTAQPGERLG